MEEKEYYSDGKIKVIRRYKDEKLHCNDGPANIGYYKNGLKQFEVWYKNDKCYREDGPAIVLYDGNGQIEEKNGIKMGNITGKMAPHVYGMIKMGKKNMKNTI
jgi:antitoxin component YwqK of YwqJK toxin-antitoxin module